MKAVIYTRVSTDEQADEGYSLEVQKNLCQKWAKQNSYQVMGVYEDAGKSATTLKGRHALQEAIIKCQEEKIDALLVLDTDRLARNPADHFSIKSALEKAGTKIVSVNQPMIDDSAEGNFLDVIMAGVNAFQSDITGRKVRKSLEKKVKDGHWPGWAPLGYINVNKGTKDKPYRVIEVDEEKGHLITELFRLYATGNYSVDSLSDFLNQKGLRSKTNRKVYRTVIYNTLKNPFYLGKMLYKGRLYPGKYQPLTTPEIFEACQKVTQDHNRNACRRRKYRWLLSGFAYCQECGSRLYSSWNHKKNKAYYHCNTKENCSQPYIPLGDLEECAANSLKNIQFSPEFTERVIQKAKELVQQSRNTQETEIHGLRNAIKHLESKRNILEDNLLDQTISKETFKRKHQELEAQIQDSNDQIATIENQRNIDIDTVSGILSLTNNIYDEYQKSGFEAKRHYLSIFFDRFEIRDKKIAEVKYTPLFKALLDANKVRVTSEWLPG